MRPGTTPLVRPADQLALIPKPIKLTDRQQAALDHISANQPVTSEELGAVLHEIRMRTGGRGHQADTRCRFCKDEGSHMGATLRKPGRRLVVHKRGLGWCLPTYKPGGTTDSPIQAASSTTDEHGFPLDF